MRLSAADLMQHPWFADMNTRMKTIPYKPKLTPSALSPRLMDRANEKLKEPSITIRERSQGTTPREKGFTPREMPWVAKESPRSPRDQDRDQERERERVAMNGKEKGTSTSPSPSPKGRENEPLLSAREKTGNEAAAAAAAAVVPSSKEETKGNEDKAGKERNPSVTVIPTEQEGAETFTASPKENEASATIPKEKEASTAISKEETAADLASGPLANKHQSSLEVNASDSPRSPVDM